MSPTRKGAFSLFGIIPHRPDLQRGTGFGSRIRGVRLDRGGSMHICHRKLLLGVSFLLMFTASCSPPATPQVDIVATAVAQAAFDLLTQTAAAASPTPLPPTVTQTPTPTETPTATPTSSEKPQLPRTVTFAACWLGGPGSPNILETNINKGKGVELLGQGNTPGWYVIRDPYFHRPCWILATDLKIFPGTDPSTYPVMTPGVPQMGQ